MFRSIVLSIIFTSGSALACDFNVDCDVGAKCVKQGAYGEGVCVGGMSPGNSNDQQPYYKRRDTTGHTCGFNTDCDYGQKCMKSGSSIEGVCM